MRYFNFAGGIEWIKYRIFNLTNIVGRELCEHILHGGTMQEKSRQKGGWLYCCKQKIVRFVILQ